MEGNLIMGASRALLEEVASTRSGRRASTGSPTRSCASRTARTCTRKIVQRTDLAPTGSGEPPAASVAAAIANAFFDATGVRIREAPMTPALVRATLKAAGVV